MKQVLEKLTLPHQVQAIRFSPGNEPTGEVIWEAPAPFSASAILSTSPLNTDSIQIVTITQSWESLDDVGRENASQVIEDWMRVGDGVERSQLIVTSFQGVAIWWLPSRIALMAPQNKIDAMLRTIIEFTYFEQELKIVERALQTEWPKWERDLPMAFAVDEKNLLRRRELQQMFQAVFLNRARISKLYPVIYAPHVYPPTLSNQLSERLRERARMTHRYESVDDQFDLFERIYEMTAQRTSDYSLARTGHILEWTIILMLGTQLTLAIFELMTRGT